MGRKESLQEEREAAPQCQLPESTGAKTPQGAQGEGLWDGEELGGRIVQDSKISSGQACDC